eukprot:jgi/Ulvmu1/11956/UM082_0035.1
MTVLFSEHKQRQAAVASAYAVSMMHPSVKGPTIRDESAPAVVRLDDDRLVLVPDHGRGEHETIPSCCVQQSHLFQDLLCSLEEIGDAVLPVCVGAVRVWMQYVNLKYTDTNKHTSPGGLRHSGGPRETGNDNWRWDELLGLYLAADVLIDDATQTEAASELAAVLQSCNTRDALLLQQVAAQLPDHLLSAALSHVRLPHCLLQLPPAFHPPALRAHHPSIDLDNTLSLPRLPILAGLPAFSAAATLTRLAHLSAAGQHLTQAAPAAVTPLSGLQALTALGLSNTGLPQSATSALAAVLPSLPLLAALDLSGSVIPAAAMRALEPALAQCAALSHLCLQNTVPPSAAGHNGPISRDVLPLSARALGRLCVLVLSSRETLCATTADPDPEAALTPTGLLQFACGLSRLRFLKLECEGIICPEHAPAAAHALASLTQLDRLCYQMPAVLPGDAQPHRRRCMSARTDDQVYQAKRAAIYQLWDAVASLTQLSALELSFAPIELGYSWQPVLASIGRLTRLRHLSLHHLGGRPDDSARLASAVDQLQLLTTLAIRCTPRSETTCADAVVVACGLPALRQLHVPLSTRHSSNACRAALVGAAHLECLTVDLAMYEPQASLLPHNQWMPLLAAAETLRLVSTWRGDDGAWIAALLPAVSAHRTLRVLRVDGLGRPLEHLLSGLLLAAAKVQSIKELTLDVACRRGSDSSPTKPARIFKLRHLVGTGIRELELTGESELLSRDAPLIRHMVQGAAALTGLRALQCTSVAEAYTVCMPEPAEMGLRTLVIRCMTAKDLELLRELLGQLCHLTRLSVGSVKQYNQFTEAEWMESKHGWIQVKNLVAELLPGTAFSAGPGNDAVY